MEQCRHLDTCDFYDGGFRNYRIGEFLLNDYCFGTSQFCAISIVWKSLGKERVPQDLLPHELSRVRHLL